MRSLHFLKGQSPGSECLTVRAKGKCSHSHEAQGENSPVTSLSSTSTEQNKRKCGLHNQNSQRAAESRGRVSEGSGGREECKAKREDSTLENLDHILSIKRDEAHPAKTQEKATLAMPWRAYKANGDL